MYFLLIKNKILKSELFMVLKVYGYFREEKICVLVGVIGSECDEFGQQLKVWWFGLEGIGGQRWLFGVSTGKILVVGMGVLIYFEGCQMLLKGFELIIEFIRVVVLFIYLSIFCMFKIYGY